MTQNIDSIIDGKRLFLIAGPCVIESEDICMTVAEGALRPSIRPAAWR